MKKFLRQIVYFLMLTLASNAGGWTFNKEAVTDVWFEDQRAVTMDDGCVSVAHEEAKAFTPHPCNHWCHAVAHFMGLPSQMTFVIPVNLGEKFALPQVALQSHSPDELFRPPRATLA
ncbi:MAG: hypothetical protein HZB95_02865 [Nitrosomonadales bacterium]|nr:hypothetical protein [Nitrosomonadales bacterium]